MEGGLTTPVVGVPDDSSDGGSNGAVYVSERNIPESVDDEITESEKITDAGNGFGKSVSVYRGLGFGGDSEDDLYVLGGAPDGTGIDGGTASLFEAPIQLPNGEGETPALGKFETVGTFTPGDGPPIDYWAAVSYYGIVEEDIGNILVGAPGADGDEGRAYSYEFLLPFEGLPEI